MMAGWGWGDWRSTHPVAFVIDGSFSFLISTMSQVPKFISWMCHEKKASRSILGERILSSHGRKGWNAPYSSDWCASKSFPWKWPIHCISWLIIVLPRQWIERRRLLQLSIELDCLFDGIYDERNVRFQLLMCCPLQGSKQELDYTNQPLYCDPLQIIINELEQFNDLNKTV